MNKLRLIGACILLLPTLVWGEVEIRVKSNYEAGTQLHAAGKTDMALVMFKQGAEAGEANCQAALGTYYYLGEAVEQDLNKAKALFEASAAQNEPLANAMLGIMYQRGEGVESDQEKAYEYASKAAYACLEHAQDQVAHHLYQGAGVKKNKIDALAWLYIASDAGLQASGDGVSQLEAELPQSEIDAAQKRKSELAAKLQCN